VRAKPGQKILIRLINGSYSVLRFTLDLDATIFGADGRGLGRAESPWSRPIPVPRGQTITLTSAQRYDLLIDAPATGGVFGARMAFHDWATDQIQDSGRGVAETRIMVG